MEQTKLRYIAVIRQTAVRDVQFCTDAECDPADDNAWQDLPEAEIYLGVFEGCCEDAMGAAAQFANTDPCNIRLMQI